MSPLAEKVFSLIAPSYGDFIAKAKIQASCSLASINMAELNKSNVHLFATQFERIMAPNVGDAAAKNLKELVLKL